MVPHAQGKDAEISELQVNPEYEALLPPLLDEDSKKLEQSILKEGILHPLIINQDKVILDGHHRLRICQALHINEVPFVERSFSNDLEEKEFVISFNLHRRHLTQTQKVELALSLLKIEMEKARRRQLSSLTHVKDSIIVPNSEQRDVEHGKAIEIAAKKVGLGKDTLWKAQKILEAAEEDEKIADAWRSLSEGKGSIHSVFQELHTREKEEVSFNPKIEGVFQVIVIDSPNLEKLKTMTLPADENCVLWLWTPVKSFPDAFYLLHRWGFQLQTMLTWVKNKKGSGNWLLDQTEHCLLATKGTPNANRFYQFSTVLIATPGLHNPKPDEFFSLVSSLCTGRKLSVFHSYPNWEGPLEADAHVAH